ncbi:hypothetical protein [Streptomyces netropsis]|uniref:Uncharacterized protein n=1 Tax=Streptomyces netropsis TaxID=55404 RepID=A0A7W7PE85_STRNE|nr:hypothetical protein [Streptomyces netropsis]MBB4885410.1 hypothetical protein [Streptomyces netropsis]
MKRPPGVTVPGERRPGAADLLRETERLGGWFPFSEQEPSRRAVEGAEEQRYVDGVARAEGAARSR